MEKTKEHWSQIPLSSVQILDGFWAQKLDTACATTIIDVLDKLNPAEGGAIGNFDRVQKGQKGDHFGPPWFDGLLYETIRAASDLLTYRYEKALDNRLDTYIAQIAMAQERVGDGYINTYTLLLCPDKRWGKNGGNLRWQHELYNAGSLVEAGVHHYQATGKRSLLAVAVRFANHICSYFASATGRRIVPAHSLPEEAFLKLYRLMQFDPSLRDSYPESSTQKYLDMAERWIDDRGRYKGRVNYLPNLQSYAQDHRPVAEQQEAVGHAVRATLLYTGLVAVGLEKGRREFLDAAQRIWNDVVSKRMHVTGGVGALHNEEMFGPDYFLPNNAYLETCAGVGMAFWSSWMSLAFAEGQFADVFERALYNNVLAGVSLSGNRYFYRNPLESPGNHHRWNWHDCPCCPPMYLKLIGALGGFLYSQKGNCIAIHHYINSKATVDLEGTPVLLRQESRYPWDGRIRLQVESKGVDDLSLRLRIPGWCEKYALRINGVDQNGLSPVDGYIKLQVPRGQENSVELDLDMPVTLLKANPYVEAARGKTAIQRGPVVYCIESVDNAPDINFEIPEAPNLAFEYVPDLLDGVVVVAGTAVDGRKFSAIPYYSWDNRSDERPEGYNQMKVWIPQRGDWSSQSNTWSREDSPQEWGDKLYRITRISRGDVIGAE